MVIAEVKVELWAPNHESRLVGLGDLPAVYDALPGSCSPVLTWNDGGDDVIIVAVGEDTCTVSMLTESTWYYLVTSSDDELIEVDMGGQGALVPRGAVIPRQLGLAVLLGANDFPNLLTEYSWIEQ